MVAMKGVAVDKPKFQSAKPIFDSCPPDYRQFSDVSH
jgi:hypothetical protein